MLCCAADSVDKETLEKFEKFKEFEEWHRQQQKRSRPREEQGQPTPPARHRPRTYQQQQYPDPPEGSKGSATRNSDQPPPVEPSDLLSEEAKATVGVRDGLAVYPHRQQVLSLVKEGIQGRDISPRMMPLAAKLSSRGVRDVLELKTEDFCFRATGAQLQGVQGNVHFVLHSDEEYVVSHKSMIRWLIVLGCLWGYRAGHKSDLEERYRRLRAELEETKASLKRHIDRLDRLDKPAQ